MIKNILVILILLVISINSFAQDSNDKPKKSSNKTVNKFKTSLSNKEFLEIQEKDNQEVSTLDEATIPKGPFNNLSQSYSRNSITPIYLNYSDGSLGLVKFSDSVQLPEKYDYNYYGNNTLSVSFPMVSPFKKIADELWNQISEMNKSALQNPSILKESGYLKLNERYHEAVKNLNYDDSVKYIKVFEEIKSKKIANKILASILIDPKLGYMTTDVIAKRAEYNASDADYLKAMNSETKMSAIRDKGLDLLKNVYFIILDIPSQQSVNDKKTPENKTINVYGIAFLFQIDIDSINRTGQFDQLIFTETDNNKSRIFNDFEFPLKLVLTEGANGSTTNFTIDAGESAKALLKSLAGRSADANTAVKYKYKSTDQINRELAQGVFSSALSAFARKYPPFQVKVPVFASNPIRAKIGAKESLSTDDLFKVTENRLGKDGKIEEYKIGWVRVKKVADNLKVADGKMEPSKFYKVGSKKVEKGMKLSERPEIGITIGVNYGIGNNIFSGGGLELGFITHLYPGLRIGLSGAKGKLKATQAEGGSGLYSTNVEADNLFLDLTIQKIFQANRFELTPMIGAYLNGATVTKVDGNTIKSEFADSYSALGLLGGVRFGINLGRNFQLNATYKADLYRISETIQDYNKVEYTSYMPQFSSSALSFGLRLYGF